MAAALGNTASITLLTGNPGSGKTLRVVHYVKQAVERGEVVFVSNLNGLKLPHIPFEDPRKWRELPPGSVLVVDEAQRFFRTRRGGDPPSYLTDMETIRHDGVRLILTTQQPDYLDTHLRGLVGLHEHLLREGGGNKVKIFRSPEVMDNVRSKKARSSYDSETWEFPTELFDLYESAQVHTVKRVLSARTKRGIVFGIIALALIVGVVFLFNRSREAYSTVNAADAPPAGARPSASGPVERRKGSETLTAVEKHQAHNVEEYVANLRPRIPTMPWSAPVYDGRAAVSEPRVFCMSSGAGVDANGDHREPGYTCITEQGTRVVMSDDGYARLVARWGEPYNPFKRPPSDQQPRRDEPAAVPVAAGGLDASPQGVVGTTGIQHAYGAMERPAP